MLDLTVFNLPRGLVALSGYRPQVSLREVSFAAQCAEMALQGVKAAAYDSDLLSFPEVQELSEVNYRLDYLTEDLRNLAEKLKVAHMTGGGNGS